MKRPTRVGRILAVAAAGALLLYGAAAQSPAGFAERVAALSEPGGYFDTDNLISNESSYLQVVPALAQQRVQGGAYIGVGPDQNFTYIAAIRPSIAFILDIRRDNMLLHLLFKALFDLSASRVEYLSLLTGRPVPASQDDWNTAPIERIVAYIDKTRPTDEAKTRARARVNDTVRKTGVGLTADDWSTIDRFHRRFIDEGLDLRFQSTGRAPRPYYPTYRGLLLAMDPAGRKSNYLASEEAFRFVKGLHARDLIIPVVGDVSGQKALAGIGRFIASRGERLSAFYISNVEFYLFHGGSFPRYIANIRQVPLARNAVLIRSAFGGYASSGASDYSSSHVDEVAGMLNRYDAGRISYYSDLFR